MRERLGVVTVQVTDCIILSKQVVVFSPENHLERDFVRTALDVGGLLVHIMGKGKNSWIFTDKDNQAVVVELSSARRFRDALRKMDFEVHI